jgi:hypothetical protein
MLEVLGIKHANKLIPLDEDQVPTDPVSENQNILMQKPVKAFAYQDHEAHIKVHMNAMQDPKILEVLGQSPQAQNLQAAMQAHINEHLGFAYRVQIEKQLGMNLPPKSDEAGENIPMDPEVEARLAPLLAQASEQLLQQNQAQAAQQQAQQQAQDPLVQMQQQELQIKQQDVQRKAQKDQADLAIKQQQQQIERERIASQEKTATLQAIIKGAADKDRMDLDSKKHISSLGIDVAKGIGQRKFDQEQKNKELFVQSLNQRKKDNQ